MNKIFHLLTSFYRCYSISMISLMVTFLLFACGDQTKTVETPVEDTSSSAQAVERNLTFNDVTLEQSDEQARPIWKVLAKQATYSKDRKVAQLKSPNGQLFQDGKPLYYITAQTGEIQQDGKKLFLKGNIVAKDPSRNLVLRGNELEWLPKEALLIVRNRLTGNNPQVQVVAREAQVFSRAQRVELYGGVQATSFDPSLQMRTERATWLIEEQKLIGDRPLQIDRYKDKKITDRAKANSGEVNLKTKIATFRQNAQINLVEPPTQITSNSLSWNTNTEIVTADQPVRIVNRQQQVTVTANQGRLDTQKNVAYLSGNVNGVGQRGQALKANTLTWYLPTQNMEANGDVFYTQANPPANFRGQKAVGNLKDQNIVVSGGNVVTEIVPQENAK
ncbi:MAG TPA: LPS export ABC transporter periplasmic protein LptC [Cyanobacteria bacterium UBA11049]|nr:LPS export ABC transporter periplasmic protein LptC [Cyanobacteria bacterium UBA11049]